MSFFQKYVDYFRWQAVNHPELRHEDVVGKKVFAVISQEAAKGDFRTGAKEKDFIMRLIIPSGSGDGDADPNSKILGGFIIAKYYSPRVDGDDSQIKAMDDAWRVGTHILTKMVNDSRNGHSFFYYSANTLASLEPAFQPKLDTGDVSYAGWMFTFRFRNPFELCLAADGQPDWDDGGETPDPIEMSGISYWTVNSDFIVQP